MVDFDSESDPDMKGVGPILPATRKAPAAEAGAGVGAGGVAECNHPSEDIHALTGTEMRRLQHFGKPPELESGRTKSRSRGWTLSESFTDALLAYARAEAK